VPTAWQWNAIGTWHTVDKTQVADPEAYARTQASGGECRAIYTRTTAPTAVDGEKLGRFGWHPDPAIDFETEVGDLDAELTNLKNGFENGTPPLAELMTRIERAMTFRVGAVETCVTAKARLRELEKEAAALAAGEPLPKDTSRFRKLSNVDDDVAGEGEAANGFNCEACGTGLIDQCYRCGAPQCCPKCCIEATAEAATLASEGEAIAWLDAENERLCDATAMRQWEASLKRPDLAEKDRVRGALEAFKRQSIALQMRASPGPAAADVGVRDDHAYGLKLIAEAIEEHFGGREDFYRYELGDTTIHDAWEAFDALSLAAKRGQGE
jgi:hypothetical protein